LPESVGDLDLALFDSSGIFEEAVTTSADTERISFNGLVGGTYFLRVSGLQVRSRQRMN
jgi:hypothetical protein